MNKVTLKNKAAACILIGITHLDTRESYENIQRVIDQAHALGHKIFREGVLENSGLEMLDREELTIVRYLNYISRSVKIASKLSGLKNQSTSLTYPEHTIRADISMFELVKELASRDLFPSEEEIRESKLTDQEITAKLMKEYQGVSQDVIIKRIQKRIVSENPDTFIGKFRKINRELRDENLVQELNMYFKNGGKNALVCFGKAHIPNIVTIMEKGGWKTYDA